MTTYSQSHMTIILIMLSILTLEFERGIKESKKI